METRRIEVLHMLKGLDNRIRMVRNDIAVDHLPTVTSHLWKAEQEIQKAARFIDEGNTMKREDEHPETGPLGFTEDN